MRDRSLRSVVIVSSFNFALKGDPEKDALIYSYQDFLNSLHYSIQIVASSRKIDLSNYLKTLEKASLAQPNPLIRLQTEEYERFLNDLLEFTNIMEKRFYIIIPFYPTMTQPAAIPNPIGKSGSKTPVMNFNEQKKHLMERTEEVIAGLSGIGLRCVALGTEDLLELFYSIYNPDVSRNQKIENTEEIGVPLVSGAGRPESEGEADEVI